MGQKHFPRGHTQSDELPDKGKLSGYISLEMKIIKRPANDSDGKILSI
jgi:hypothetical protein